MQSQFGEKLQDLESSASELEKWNTSSIKTRGFAWRLFIPLDNPPGDSGRKIHASFSKNGLSSVITAMIANWHSFPSVAFKLPSTLNGVETINSGAAGSSQIGKVMTFYPNNDGEFQQVVDWFVAHIKDFDGPDVPNESLAQNSTTLFFRRGPYRSLFFENSRGQPVRYYRSLANAEIVIDKYESDNSERSESRELIESPNGFSFRVTKVIKTFPSQVAEAIDLRNIEKVFVKRVPTKDHAAAARIANEARSLEALRQLSFVPTPVECWQNEKWTTLAVKNIAGIRLDKLALHSTSIDALLADQVAEIHALGIVHGDLKLANFLALGASATIHDRGAGTEAGQLAILDFDNAKRVGEVQDGFRTPGHDSPELIAAAASQPSRFIEASFEQDIYSLGCCLFHLRTGTNPSFIASGDDRLRRLVEISKINRPLKNIILACLSPNPIDRPKISDIQNLLAGGLDNVS